MIAWRCFSALLALAQLHVQGKIQAPIRAAGASLTCRISALSHQGRTTPCFEGQRHRIFGEPRRYQGRFPAESRARVLRRHPKDPFPTASQPRRRIEDRKRPASSQRWIIADPFQLVPTFRSSLQRHCFGQG